MDKQITESIARNVEEYRTSNGLRKADVAASLGITTNALRFKMRGQYDWKWSEILTLSSLTGLTPDELAGTTA